MKTLTIRNVTPELASALEDEKNKLGLSMNGTVLYLLNNSLSLNTPFGRKTNGLEKLAGRWSDEEFEEFQEVLAKIRVIDKDMWE